MQARQAPNLPHSKGESEDRRVPPGSGTKSAAMTVAFLGTGAALALLAASTGPSAGWPDLQTLGTAFAFMGAIHVGNLAAKGAFARERRFSSRSDYSDRVRVFADHGLVAVTAALLAAVAPIPGTSPKVGFATHAFGFDVFAHPAAACAALAVSGALGGCFGALAARLRERRS